MLDRETLSLSLIGPKRVERNSIPGKKKLRKRKAFSRTKIYKMLWLFAHKYILLLNHAG